MSNFSILLSGVWTVPPNDAMPISVGDPSMDGAPVVRENEPYARDGLGNPVAVDDEKYAVVGRPYINATGLAWWYTTVGLGSSVSKRVYVRLWNPQTQAWTDYSAVMWRPVHPGGRAGYKLEGFKVKFTGLEAL